MQQRPRQQVQQQPRQPHIPQKRTQRRQVNPQQPANKDHSRVLRIVAVLLLVLVLIAGGAAACVLTGLIALPGEEQGEGTAQDGSQEGATENGEQNSEAAFSVSEDTYNPPTTITISFAGDCTLGTDENFSYSGSFTQYYDENGADYFFAGVKDIFAADDLTVVNCEGVLTDATTRDDKEYAYKGKPEYAEIFARSSIECTGIWNNHIYDYGWGSRGDTIDALESAGLVVFGDEIIGYTEVKGVKIALIAGNMLTTGLSEENNVIPRIYEAQSQGAQIIIVQMHWGEMSEYNPTDAQIQLARDCIDAGATIVEGSHQHVLQGYEEYNGHYIVYGLGNFCYGGSRGLFDPDCYIFQQTFTLIDGEIQPADSSSINVIPCLISSDRSVNNYQPVVVDGDEAARVEGKIEDSNAYIAAW